MPRKRKASPKKPPVYKPWSRYGSPILSAEDLQQRYSQYRRGLSAAIPAESDSAPFLRSSALSKETAINLAHDFLSRLLRVEKDDISRIEWNPGSPRMGDLLLPSSINIEVKARAVNPSRYPLNHIAVADLDFDSSSKYGFYDLARILKSTPEELSNSLVREFGYNTAETFNLGTPEHFKMLLNPIASCSITMYINSKENFIYIYKRDELLKHISTAIRNSGFRKGQGGEHPNRLSVLVPLPRWRFSMDKHGQWRYTGVVTSSKEAEKAALVQHLISLPNI